MALEGGNHQNIGAFRICKGAYYYWNTTATLNRGSSLDAINEHFGLHRRMYHHLMTHSLFNINIITIWMDEKVNWSYDPIVNNYYISTDHFIGESYNYM